jgi:DNA processing protein
VDPAQKKFWVGFSLVKGIGAVRTRQLLDTFGDLAAAWAASPANLQAAGLSPKILTTLLQVKKDVSLDALMDRIAALGIEVLTWQDETYPARLMEVDQPPPVLYVRGGLASEDEWAVAVVGTRRLTAYGRQAAEDIAAALARSGVTVVSGMARGVDGVAHQAAIKAGGRTLAVLGCGVDRIYPPEHRRLADEISAHGALMSDYPPGTEPDAANFPPRNRIISGLSKAVVVIEAGETSGALITASFAAEQGREVFALPGQIYAPQSKGTNRLIRDGARPLLDPQELLEALDLTRVSLHREARHGLPTDATEARLYAALSLEPVHVDELQAQVEMPIEQVTAALAMMELKGLARQVGGMNYVAVRDALGEYHT